MLRKQFPIKPGDLVEKLCDHIYIIETYKPYGARAFILNNQKTLIQTSVHMMPHQAERWAQQYIMEKADVKVLKKAS